MKTQRKLLAILAIIIISISAGTAYYYIQNNQTPATPNNSPTPNTTTTPTPTSPITQTPTPSASPASSPKETPKPTATSIPNPTPTATPSPTPTPTPTPTPPTIAPLDLWWQTNWSNNGATLNVTYNQIANSPSKQSKEIQTYYFPSGMVYYRTLTTNTQNEDTCGKLANTTTRAISYSSSGSFYLSPNPPAANGSLVYPSSSSFEQSQFFRNFTSTVTYDNYTPGYTPTNGTYNEEFLGHIATSAGEITFSGNVTAPLTWAFDQAFVNRTEKTSYFLNGKPYAETSLTTTWESNYINGAYRTMRENDITETFFADGSQRTSQITILYQRDENGTITGKSGTGTILGTDSIGGQSVNYTGTINIAYVRNQAGAWLKTGYYENRTAALGLLKREPFEVLFIEDSQMRPLFSSL